jgi:dipeptidyl aminopeptidase/acylaminoacyl peptidase
MMCGMRAALLGLLISGPCVTPSTNMQQHAYQPLPEDTPSPVAGESTLAGEDPPDITRFLKVRRAGAPSLSPEGTRVAYSTGVTGVPQVWVVGAEGGVPRQLTFGEPITFHAWSPAGDWIAYGADRGGTGRASGNCWRRPTRSGRSAASRRTAAGSPTRPPSATASTSTSTSWIWKQARTHGSWRGGWACT